MQVSALLAAARRVRLTGFSPARDALAGGYRSAYRGYGLEYEESREYAPGDDAAALDWKVTARLSRPFVKRFREERARTVMLAVDVSASMAAGTGPGDTAFAAALAAVILARSAAASRDRVGLVLFSDRVEAFVPPGKGPGQERGVAAVLAGAAPRGRGTDPRPALALVAAALAHRSPVFLVSDFAGADFAAALGSLAARHDVTAVVVGGAGQEFSPPRGILTVADVETGRRLTIDCAGQAARAKLAAVRREARQATLVALRRAGAGVVEIDPAAHPGPALAAHFRRRARPAGYASPDRRSTPHG
ncbi:DUF58 domain-containing protein [Solidesulfovibrio sp.]|uniref:DUF58 domain-containing protein n=1 Tax=Solidesulfovibrio sp. TaxID=2910990 RepID=UPI002B1EDBE6|nr:DUF58 domain-containing protein [Solidesulfovibrio sp.]MEA4855146.1 DUF58 domain-containing protein [Solidesulfovibrio sp.]